MAATPYEVTCRDLRRPGSRIVMHVCASESEWLAKAQRTAVDRSATPKTVPLPPVFSMAYLHEPGGGMNSAPAQSFQRY